MAHGCFVNSISQVSCQKPLSDDWFNSPIFYQEAYVRAQEPDTKGLIVPAEARRMSKILKRTVCTALTALNDSSVTQPDAIITGTGMGCMENSEKFLIDMSRFGENCLKPTLFMQSTHNTISSLIAIILKNHGYNNTYSHKGISFESALLDAWIQINAGMIDSALVGAHDEITPFTNLVLAKSHPEYSFISETSVSCILTSTPEDTDKCEIRDVQILYRPSPDEIAALLTPESDRILVIGINGNDLNDKPYHDVIDILSFKPYCLRYKNVFGDNFSSSALGFYTGVKIIEKQIIPTFLEVDSVPHTVDINNITILNHSDGTAWSIIRLGKI